MINAEELRKKRRHLVKHVGKRTIRGLADFMGRQSLVGDPPVFEAGTFPFVSEFEDNWRKIRAELDEVLKDRDSIPAFHEISPDQVKISKGNNWKTFILYGFGTRADRNADRCPETSRMLERVPGLKTAWFSILAPRYHIRAHRGVTKGLVRAHVGLKVPQDREKCRMRVEDEILTWEEGRAFVFDDTYDHEVWNDTDEERAVLIFDFDRPMRMPGRMVSSTLLWAIKRSAYYKDAKKNMLEWDQRFERAVERAESLLDEPTTRH